MSLSMSMNMLTMAPSRAPISSLAPTVIGSNVGQTDNDDGVTDDNNSTTDDNTSTDDAVGQLTLSPGNNDDDMVTNGNKAPTTSPSSTATIVSTSNTDPNESSIPNDNESKPRTGNDNKTGTPLAYVAVATIGIAAVTMAVLYAAKRRRRAKWVASGASAGDSSLGTDNVNDNNERLVEV